MVTLKLLQAQFQDYIINSDPQCMLPFISPDERFSAVQRLKVYHDAYRLRLLEILRLDFPKTHMLLGDQDFDKAFYHYVGTHPSHHFSVRYFGQHFSNFLENTPPFNAYPVLAEMARFEWAVSHTIDAQDETIVTTDHFTSLSPVDWPHLVFKLHSSVISHVFKWDVPQLWQHIDQEAPPRTAVQMPEPVRWLFWRKGIKSFFQSCSPYEEIMFCAVQACAPFSQICEKLLDMVPEDQIALLIAQTLHRWINEEMITKIALIEK